MIERQREREKGRGRERKEDKEGVIEIDIGTKRGEKRYEGEEGREIDEERGGGREREGVSSEY